MRFVAAILFVLAWIVAPASANSLLYRAQQATKLFAPPHLTLAQFSPPISAPVATYCVNGPGDVQPYFVFGGLRAYSMAGCGQPAIYVCNSTGGTDIACADIVTSKTTGLLVPTMIGGLNCGSPTEDSGNCTVKYIYNQAPLNATCTVRGGAGTPGTCDAIQNTPANRYALMGTSGSCNPSVTAGACMYGTGASSGYTLNTSISLTQPFNLYTVAYTINSTSSETFLSVGNASIAFSTSSAGNVLTSCDSSGGTTAANVYQNNTFAPTFVSTIIAQCIGGTGEVLQNMFVGHTTSSGGSTSASGTPSVFAAGGSPVNAWEFGISIANLIALVNSNSSGYWTPAAMHSSACLAYGYTCYYSGAGDITPWTAFWSTRAYSAAAAYLANSSIGPLLNVCSADNTQCGDVLPQNNRTGFALGGAVPMAGGEYGDMNIACWTTINSTGSSYNIATGALVLAVAAQPADFGGVVTTGIASGNNFALGGANLSGTNASLLGGAYTATSVSTSGATTTINATAPTGLGAITITGGYLSTCTIKTFYDLVGTYCSGPCNLTQTTVSERAIFNWGCGSEYAPNYYPSACASFIAGASQSYSGPAATNIPVPFSLYYVAQRNGNESNYNTVISGTGTSTASAGFDNSANTAYGQDGWSLASGAAMDGLFHSVLTESNGTNLKLFVDGVGVDTLSTTTSAVIAAPFGLGNKLGNSFYLQGNFFEGGLASQDLEAFAPRLSVQVNLYLLYP